LEILSPPAISFLDGIGIGRERKLGVRCSGVLRKWENTEPDFFDYELFNAIEARAVNREELQRYLSAAARRDGAVQIEAHAAIDKQNDKVCWRSVDGEEQQTRFDRVCVATGRSSSLAPFASRTRIRRNNLIAFAMPWQRHEQLDALGIEATADGWWYSPPSDHNEGDLVFVTDREFVSAEKTQRSASLRTAFANCNLMQSLGSNCDVDVARGMDAHAGNVRDPIKGCFVAIGDLAISLDPLSGSGILRSLEGAYIAVQEYIESGSVGFSYRDWLATTVEKERRNSREQYADAAARFSRSAFWFKMDLD
jgi:flavin-dependent dehydrogenase